MDSKSNHVEASRLYQDLSKLWGSAGMYARNWISNSVAVIKQISEEDRAAEIDLINEGFPLIKTLDIMWK